MIDVQNVSMRFNLGIEKNNSLKQMAVDLFSKSAREKRKMHKKILTNKTRDGNISSSKEKQLHKERSLVIPMGT